MRVALLAVATALLRGAPPDGVRLLPKQSPSSARNTTALHAQAPACGKTLPASTDPAYYQKLLALDRCGCGQVCNTDPAMPSEDGKYFKFIQKSIDCQALFSNVVAFQPSTLQTPPHQMPAAMRPFYTLEGAADVQPWYFNNYQPGNSVAQSTWTPAIIDAAILKARSGAALASGYHDVSKKLHAFLQKHKSDIAGKHCAVIGSQRPWVEALLLSAGAKKITTVEYGNIKSTDSRIATMHPSALPALFAGGGSPFDCVVSYSSIEHAGLGRYGDVLDPWGDLRVMAQMQCVSRPQAAFFVGVPFAADRVAWNAHRYYGERRLPQLFANIRVTDSSDEQTVLAGPALVKTLFQPMFFGKKA